LERTKSPKARAVIFDFDGTLAQTMEDNYRAWKAVLSEYDLALQPQDYYLLEGVSVHELPKRLFAARPLTAAETETVVQKKERHYLENHRFAFYPGVEELVALLKSKKTRLGIVTAGLLERLKRSVPAGFLEKFDALVTAAETSEGKPSPGPYLKGAEKLGVAPQDCIVIENAPLGIQSAKRAGAYCIALCTTLDRKYLGEADEVVDTFKDLPHTWRIKQLLE
jgi:beta-phosphoglucomutase